MKSLPTVAVLVLATGLGFSGWVAVQTADLRADRDYERNRAQFCEKTVETLLAVRQTDDGSETDHILHDPPVFISFLNTVARNCAIPSTAMTVDRDLPHAAPRLNTFVRDVSTRVTLRGVSIKQLVGFFERVQDGRTYLQLRELSLRQVPRGSGKWEATGVLSYFLWDPATQRRPSE